MEILHPSYQIVAALALLIHAVHGPIVARLPARVVFNTPLHCPSCTTFWLAAPLCLWAGTLYPPILAYLIAKYVDRNH